MRCCLQWGFSPLAKSATARVLLRETPPQISLSGACRYPVGSSTRREEMSTLVHGTRTHPSSVLSALCVGGK